MSEKGERPGDVTVSAVRDDAAEDAAPAAPAARLAATDLPVVDPGRYALAEEHGRGGAGRVWRARDARLERTVAIKELAQAPDGRAAARFVREALVTARLQHPGIVPVYEAGRWPDGSPFYAMRLVSGETLRDAIAARATLDERLALVPRVVAAAEAVAYAHSQGVIHRDLKPANVIIGPFGETVVVDWGLAKDTRAGEDSAADDPGLYTLVHAEMTRVGAVVGTPAYMPPEQARGEPVDARADVYAIGAMLYHVLTARPPFEGDPDTVLARVARDAPPALAGLAPDAPRDLVAIVDKAMARDAAARYPSAEALARDLSRFLTGQLVAARAYGRLTLLLRWLRRHRAIVSVATVLLAALAVTATVSARRIVRERNLAQRERNVARERSAALTLAQARAWLDRDPTTTLAWLKQYPADGPDWAAVRAVAVDAESRGAARLVLADARDVEQVSAAVVTPDGGRIVTAVYAAVQVWDRDGRPLARHQHDSAVFCLAVTPDGSGIALGDDAGAVWIMDAAGSARRLGAHDAWVSDLAISPDGAWLASGAADGSLRLWPLTGAGPPRRLGTHGDAISRVAFVAGGQALVTAGLDGTVRRWEVATGAATTLVTVTGDNAAIQMDVSPDGARVVVSAGEGVVLWTAAGGARELGRHRGLTALALLPDGDALSGGGDGALLRWPADGGEPRALHVHDRPVTAILVSDDGRRIVSGDTGGDIRVLQEGGTRVLRGHRRAIRGLGFVPDGAALLSWDESGVTREWPLAARGRLVATAPNDVFRVAFLGDAARVVTTSRDGGVRVVDVTTGDVRLLGRHDLPAYDVDVFRDGRGVVTGGWDGFVVVWRDDAEVRRLRHGQQVGGVAAAPDGASVFSGGADGRVLGWDLASGAERLLCRHDAGVMDVAVSPDGALVASAGDDRVVRVTRLADGSVRELRGHEAAVYMLLFAPDSRRLFSASADGTVREWDLAGGGAARVLRGHGGRVRTMALSPDGRLLASGSVDETVRLWDLASGEARVLRGHAAEVRHVAFSPDGAWLATAGWDDTVRLWRVHDGATTVLQGHTRRVHRVAFSPDGRMLVSASQDGRIGLWTMTGLASAPDGASALRRWLDGVTSAVIDERGVARSTSR